MRALSVFPYQSWKRLSGSRASAVAAIESTGVMPLPAANAANRFAPPAVVGVEAAIRCHDLHAFAGHGRARKVGRHAPARLQPDADGERLRALGIDDGVGPPLLASADLAAHGDVLAGAEPERLAQASRQVESHGDRIVGSFGASCDDQRVELQHEARCT